MQEIGTSTYHRWILSSTEKKQIVKALHACPCMKDYAIRDVVLRQLPDNIFKSLTRSQRQDIDVENIIDACLNYIGGIEHLIDRVYEFDRGTWQAQDLFDTLQAVQPQPVPWIDVAELKTILSQESLAEDLLWVCYSSIHISFPRKYEEEGEVLPSILDHLAKRRLSDGSVPLLVFLLRLTSYLSNPMVQDKLNLWIQRTALYLGIDVPTSAKDEVSNSPNPESPQRTARHYLLVKVEPDLWREGSFLIQGWLFHNGLNGRIEGLPIYDGPLSLPQIPQQIEKLIDESHQRLGNKSTELTLEFLLPRVLLCHEIDQWKITVGKGLQFSIGAKYQTVVRSYERMYDADMRRTWHLWRARWTSYQHFLQKTAQIPLFFYSEEECEWQDALYARLIESEVICLILALIPTEIPDVSERDTLFTILNAGTPIALWLRRNTDSALHILEELKLDLSSMSLDHLPKLVLSRRLAAVKERDETHPGSHLTLLWDDPSRLPPDVQYSYQAPEG